MSIDAVSWGVGEQDKQPHFWINAWGKDADALIGSIFAYSDIDPEHLTCTRIDLQMTVPSTRQKRLALVDLAYKDGELGEFRGKGRPQVYSYLGDDGDTLYIGSGKSEKFIRVYDKPVLYQGRRHVFERTEVQLRGKKADATFKKLSKLRPQLSRNLIASMLKGYYNQLPALMVEELSLLPLLGAYTQETVELEETESEPDKRVQWLLSLEKTIAYECSTRGEKPNLVREMLLKVLVTAATQDNLSSWFAYKLLSPEGEIIDPLAIDAE